MFRVVFKPKLGAWVIQIRVCVGIWKTVRHEGEIHTFSNFGEAAEYVEERGINKVYRNYSDMPAFNWSGEDNSNSNQTTANAGLSNETVDALVKTTLKMVNQRTTVPLVPVSNGTKTG